MEVAAQHTRHAVYMCAGVCRRVRAYVDRGGGPAHEAGVPDAVAEPVNLRERLVADVTTLELAHLPRTEGY